MSNFRKKSRMNTNTSSEQGKWTFGSEMCDKTFEVDILTRLPHIGEQIFESLDNLSLMRCKKISRSCYDFINEQKFLSIRIIKKFVKESNREYTECPKHWQKLFRRSNTEQVIELANKIQKYSEYSLSHVGKGLTPLHLVTMFYQIINLETIENILKVETVKNPKDTEGNTPLHHAARKGNFEVFLLIKEKVDDINPKNEHGNTPLHRAALSDDDSAKKIVELIQTNVIEKNPENILGITPLHNAALSGRLDIFQFIYKNAANQNPVDCYGETPFHKAADGTGGGLYKHCQFYPIDKKCQHDAICQLIMNNIEDKKPVNFKGKTPLQLAEKSNHSLVVNVLTHH